MIGESEDLATSLLSDADMNHDSKIDLDGKKKTIWKIYYLVIPITYSLYDIDYIVYITMMGFQSSYFQ